MIKIAIYGKGGIGKSTTTSNLSAVLNQDGMTVLQIGCDPKADSTTFLMHGESVPTVLNQMKVHPDGVTLDDLVFESPEGVLCVEAGGPTPGVGCAGRGIITALEKLEELGAYEWYKPDVVFYDVLGDVVCGGFAMPIRGGYADKVFIVTSGEAMSLYSATNITQAIRNFGRRNYAQCGGFILNCRNVENEYELVSKTAQEEQTEIIGIIPRSDLIAKAELAKLPLVEYAPESSIAQIYRELAQTIVGMNAYASK